MFTSKPYILNAQALSSTPLLTVSKQAIVSEIERDPRFWYADAGRAFTSLARLDT